MKHKVIIVTVLLALLGVGAGSACFGGGKNLVDQVKMVPKEVDFFVYWDVEALGEDVYTVWKEWKNQEGDWLGDMMDIATGEVELFVQASAPDLGVVTIVTGEFILDEVEERLEDNGYTLDPYLGIRMMTKTEDGKEVAVAFHKKSVIVGGRETVEKCIEIITDKEGSYSLYEDPSMRKIIDKLPGGVMTGIERNQTLYLDLVGVGMSLEKGDEETLKLKAFYKFDVSGAAKDQDTLTKVMDHLAVIDLTTMQAKGADREVKSKDEFIEGTATVHISDFAYFNLVESPE